MKNLNPKKLNFWFMKKKHILKYFEKNVLDKNNSFKNRIFFDNGSKILLVAHIDTVHKPKIYYSKDGKIFGAGFDDRLGCFAAYKFSLENKTDLLLCDNEESGQSTAEHHDCKKYNWIAEMDRAGCDVVTYDQDNDNFLKAIGKHFKIGFGSFTDISSLKTDCCTINIGIGYHDPHSIYSYYIQSEFDRQLKIFKEFYQENKDIDFGKRKEKPKNYWYNDNFNDYGFSYKKSKKYNYNKKRYDDFNDDFNFDAKNNMLKDNETFCEFCEKTIKINTAKCFNDSILCPACYQYFSENPAAMDPEKYDNLLY